MASVLKVDQIQSDTGTINLASALVITSGIQFPAAKVPSADANNLDDYEEGTWTPTLLFGTGNTGMTFSVAPTGTYIKIGKLVWCRFGFRMSAKGSSTGVFTMTGIPFATVTYGAYREPTGPMVYSNMTFTNQVAQSACGVSSATTVIFYGTNTSGAEFALENTHFTDTSFIRGSFMYEVS